MCLHQDMKRTMAFYTSHCNYCAYHVPVQPNFRRYYFYCLPEQAQILLDHFNVLDELWGKISTGFDNR